MFLKSENIENIFTKMEFFKKFLPVFKTEAQLIASAHPHLALNTVCATQSETKQKVVLDLLNTERTYLIDLETWESVCVNLKNKKQKSFFC